MPAESLVLGGGAGAMGGVSGAGSVSGTASAGPASSSSASQGGAGEASAKVTISQAAQEALAAEAPATGASFSAEKASDGRTYVGNVDRNGFRNPDAPKMAEPTDAKNVNSLGQDVSELNKMSELLAALLLARLMEKERQGQ